MDAEQLELELENRILNGAIDDSFSAANEAEDTGVQAERERVGSIPIDQELASQQRPQAAATAKPPMRNPARERLKRELGFLREYAAELEAELNSLRAPKRPLLEHATIARIPPSTALADRTGVAWKSTAHAERSKRSQSERENGRLRRSLETQLRVAEELSLYLREHGAATPPPSTVAHEAPTHIPPLLVSTSFSLVVTQLLNDIDRAYAVTRAVFAGPSWETLPDERVFTTSVKTRSVHGADQMYIELVDTAYRSHAYEKTCAAAWEATRLVYASEARVIAQGPSTDDVLAVRYRTTGQTRRGTSKDLLVTFVAKRYRERDHTVLVWRTCDSPALYDRDMPVQAVSDETGWMVLTRVPDQRGGPSATALDTNDDDSKARARRPAGTAFFQACSRLVPVWLEGDVVDSSVRTQLAIGEFTNVVLSATEADVTGFETTFQKLVLHDGDQEEGPADPRTDNSASSTASDPLADLPHYSEEYETLVAFV